jgi:serine/threonine-protein kinase
MIGWAVGGAGVLSLAVGTVFGVRAITKRQESNKQCDSDGCTEDGFDLNEQAKRAATVANVTIGLGLAGVAGGLVLVLTAPTRADSTTSASVGPVVGPGRGGLLVRGRFQ